MVKSGLAETTIVAAIAANDTQFDLSSSGLQSLSQAGVSSKVIRAMLAAESKKKDAAAAAESATAAPGCQYHARFDSGCVGRHEPPRHEPAGDATGNVAGPDARK